MVGFAFWVVGVIVATALSLLVHVTPALFHISIFFERLIFGAAQRLVARPLAIGELTLVSGLAWAGGTALLGWVFLAGVVGSSSALLIAGSMGLVWGLSVGYQAAVQEVAHYLRQPGVLEHHRPGYLGSQAASNGSQAPSMSVDDLWHEGIILGEAREQQRGG